jgi:hypothetical protein
MGLNETLVFYLLAGVAIAVAVFLVDGRQNALRTAFLLLTSVLFWPLYLPLLLSARTARDSASEPESKPQPDEMASAIVQVERELDAALSSLDGWAEDALAGEGGRITELCHALAAQAARIRQMDDLLSRTEATEMDAYPKSSANGLLAHEAIERWHKSQQARANNLTRLAQVRRQAHADLMATLAWIRELVSMIHLAKFTGAPASRAEELVAQIAAAVEGVSAVAWPDPEPPTQAAVGLQAGHAPALDDDKLTGVRL